MRIFLPSFLLVTCFSLILAQFWGGGGGFGGGNQGGFNMNGGNYGNRYHDSGISGDGQLYSGSNPPQGPTDRKGNWWIGGWGGLPKYEVVNPDPRGFDPQRYQPELGRRRK